MAWDNNGQGGGPWGGGGSRPTPPPHNRRGNNEELEDLLRKVKDFIPKGTGGGFPTNNNRTYLAIAIAAFGLWLATGVYTVDTKEKAVVMRFGKHVDTKDPGLNYHLPYPFERVEKVKVTDRYKEEIGYRSTTSARGNTSDSTRDIPVLTGDENIAYVSFEVQWQITNAAEYLFNVRSPRLTVREAAESAMREVIGITPISELLSSGRTAVQLQIKELLQKMLDSYDAGIRIEEINLKGEAPPTVVDAFKDVQAAKTNLAEAIEKAKAYHNDVIPKSRGEAERLLQAAEAYKQQEINKAEGEASRFRAIYEQYKQGKDVMQSRMYMETLEQILPGMNKVIVDNKNGTMPYLPLNEITKKKQ